MVVGESDGGGDDEAPGEPREWEKPLPQKGEGGGELGLKRERRTLCGRRIRPVRVDGVAKTFFVWSSGDVGASRMLAAATTSDGGSLIGSIMM